MDNFWKCRGFSDVLLRKRLHDNSVITVAVWMRLQNKQGICCSFHARSLDGAVTFVFHQRTHAHRRFSLESSMNAIISKMAKRPVTSSRPASLPYSFIQLMQNISDKLTRVIRTNSTLLPAIDLSLKGKCGPFSKYAPTRPGFKRFWCQRKQPLLLSTKSRNAAEMKNLKLASGNDGVVAVLARP